MGLIISGNYRAPKFPKFGLLFYRVISVNQKIFWEKIEQDWFETVWINGLARGYKPRCYKKYINNPRIGQYTEYNIKLHKTIGQWPDQSSPPHKQNTPSTAEAE